MRNRPSGFELVELESKPSDKETDDLVAITHSSLADEPMFQLRIRELSTEQKDAWIRKFWLQGPFSDPRRRSFAIRDLSNDILVGYTTLQCPATQTEAEKEVTVEVRNTMMHELGSEGQAFIRLFDSETKDMVSKHGYDPQLHFHKRNTLIRSDYQKLGIGTWLTQYCDEIADQARQPTFVMARPKAWKMLENTGFRYLDRILMDVTMFGVEDHAEIRYYRRDPPSV